MLHVLIVAWILAAGTTPAQAADLAGPIPATVLRVIDGDTIEVRAEIWPRVYAEERVRLAGIDTPELRGRCPAERELARQARVALTGLAGAAVRLEAIGRDKYGRVLARVHGPRGDVAAALIAAGLARPYAGARREGWC